MDLKVNFKCQITNFKQGYKALKLKQTYLKLKNNQKLL